MDTFHIYDDSLIEKDFCYFFCTWVDGDDPWDYNSKFHGFLITPDDRIVKTIIPQSVYNKIPEQLKRSPQYNQYSRFRVSKNGNIESVVI